MLSFITTLTALNSTQSKASDTSEKTFVFSILWVFGGLGWCLANDQVLLHDGVLWAGLASSASLAFVTSMVQSFRHIPNFKKSGSSAIPNEFSSSVTTVCGLASVVTIFSAFALSLIAHTPVEMDFLVPLSTIILLTTRKDLFIHDVYPAELSVIVSILWWLGRMIYLVFIHGYGVDHPPVGFQESFGMFHTASISLWSSELPTWLVIANVFMGIIPLPSVILSFLKRKDESEEILLFFSLMGLVSLIGSQANCVRFIGGFSTVYGCWRSYEMSQRSATSNRII
jgi:hypothetical protein